MPTKQSASEPTGTNYWRISSETKANIDLAIKAKQWGMRRALGLSDLGPGDRVVFYVSKGQYAGYWGAATVTSKLFMSKTMVWPEDLYPVRFTFAPDLPARTSPVLRDRVIAKLGTRRLRYQRQTAVMKLADQEYGAIASLLAESS